MDYLDYMEQRSAAALQRAQSTRAHGYVTNECDSLFIATRTDGDEAVDAWRRASMAATWSMFSVTTDEMRWDK